MTSVRTSFAYFFNHTGFILGLGIIIGLVLPQGAPWIQSAITPILALIMTVSLIEVPSRVFLDFKKLLFPILLSITLNYVVLSGAFIGLSSLILQDYELWAGFVLNAAAPPPVAVIPFTLHLGGNTSFVLVGSVAAYIASLAITPAISLSLLGANLIDPQRLLIVLATLIIAPLAISRLLQLTNLVPVLEKTRQHVVSWGFFLVTYTIMGVNQDAFLGEPETLLRLSLISFIASFVLGYLINRVARFLKVDKANRISFVIMGTRKNVGLSAAIALTFFGSRAAMPAAVFMTISIIQFILLTIWIKRIR